MPSEETNGTSEPTRYAWVHHNDPFRDGVPHPVRVLLSTISADVANVDPSVMRYALLSSFAFRNINFAAEFAQITSASSLLPDADQPQTKRNAWYLLKRWLRETADSGFPLVQDEFIQSVIKGLTETKGSAFWESSRVLDEGRFHTLMALREMAQAVIYAARQLRTNPRLTATDIATSLAPYLVDQTKMASPLLSSGAYTRRFVPEFAEWLDIYTRTENV